ncbi:MAG TPA: AbrB/MazE/SpoVT family DNA-binding domain-containing protein [Dissulfurispiraceae bacterium]
METVIVGERGQVTIPKKLRERFGIKSKSPVVFELREDGIMIKPALTVTVREFSEGFIKSVAKADELKEGEREQILSKWKRR